MKHPTSYRLPQITLDQIEQLRQATQMTQAEIVQTAIDRMFREEIKMTATYTVVSDRFAQEPTETTLDQFYKDAESLGWDRPNLVPQTIGADQYRDATTGEVILKKKST
jgi:hypothetical protein